MYSRFILFLLFLLAFGIYPASAAELKDAAVSRQLDCVDQKLKDGKSIDWNDICSTTSAGVDHTTSFEDTKPLVFTSSFGVNYRKDELKWSIADTDNDPDILSELTWKDVHSAEVETHGNAVLHKRWIVLDWRAGYGWIYSGKNQDSDYLNSGKQNEFSRSNNNTDQGRVYDLSGGSGVRLDILPIVPADVQRDTHISDLSMDVLGGYSFSRQKYYMTDGNQTVAPNPSQLGPFPGLKSTYQADWEGPWVGTQLNGAADRWHGLARFEYHWADYRGQADWNLRSDFAHPKSFEHNAEGNGYVVQASGGYNVLPWWSVDVLARWQRWEANDGTDTTYFSDGTSLDTKLNESIWTSLSVGLASTMRF